MRTFVIGDIHGGLLALEQVMKKAQVTTKDTFIFLGDYVDGWSQSAEVIDYLIDLKSKQNCICIRGNHDQLALEWLENRHDDLDEENGTNMAEELLLKATLKYLKKKRKHILLF